jgi:hypothetical protein
MIGPRALLRIQLIHTVENPQQSGLAPQPDRTDESRYFSPGISRLMFQSVKFARNKIRFTNFFGRRQQV